MTFESAEIRKKALRRSWHYACSFFQRAARAEAVSAAQYRGPHSHSSTKKILKMKSGFRNCLVTGAIFAAALVVGTAARAETPREELAHAYVLLKMANHDYHGHRGEAMKAVEKAGDMLGLDLKGHGSEREGQMKSDELVAESGRLLRDARGKLEARDRDRVAAHVDHAIEEVDKALRAK